MGNYGRSVSIVEQLWSEQLFCKERHAYGTPCALIVSCWPVTLPLAHNKMETRSAMQVIRDTLTAEATQHCMQRKVTMDDKYVTRKEVVMSIYSMSNVFT
jgi:hypothetical protein